MCIFFQLKLDLMWFSTGTRSKRRFRANRSGTESDDEVVSRPTTSVNDGKLSSSGAMFGFPSNFWIPPLSGNADPSRPPPSYLQMAFPFGQYPVMYPFLPYMGSNFPNTSSVQLNEAPHPVNTAPVASFSPNQIQTTTFTPREVQQTAIIDPAQSSHTSAVLQTTVDSRLPFQTSSSLNPMCSETDRFDLGMTHVKPSVPSFVSHSRPPDHITGSTQSCPDPSAHNITTAESSIFPDKRFLFDKALHDRPLTWRPISGGGISQQLNKQVSALLIELKETKELNINVSTWNLFWYYYIVYNNLYNKWMLNWIKYKFV